MMGWDKRNDRGWQAKKEKEPDPASVCGKSWGFFPWKSEKNQLYQFINFFTFEGGMSNGQIRFGDG